MAIDPTTTTTVRVSELASAGYNTTDLIPHEVAGILKKGNLQDLATFIGSIIDVEGSVGFRAVNVTDGQTLPATTEEEFILVGPGTFPNVGGGSAITTTEPLNALVSNGTYWFIGVEIPIAANGAWGSIEGNIETQTDLQDALDLKADLVDGKVPASQLPSYVDDVVEVANYAALPSTGETGKIYITIDNNKVYRWSGSAYIEIAENNAVWGLIEGTLSSQTDLNTSLGLKVPYTGATGNVDLGTHKLTASDLVVNHASGSGAAATISKGGSGEALTVTKSSGSGNAASILGGVTLLDELHLNTDLADAYIASAATWNAKQSALTFSSPLVNTSGTISIPAASGSVNGYLSSTDWTTFNTKQAALNGTGFVKISGTTISYDNSTYALDSAVVKVNTDQNVRGIKTFLGNQTATTLKLIVADYYNDGFITSDNGMLRLLNGTTELFNLASTGDLTAKSFVKTGGTSSQFLMADGSVSTGSGGTVTGTGTTNYISKFTGSSAIGNSLIYDNGTNIGIGTTSPSQKLHVVGNGLVEGVILYRNGATNILNIGGDQNMYGGTNSDGGVFVYGANKLHLSTNSARRLTVDGSGNVGIGTTSPVNPLTVQSNGSAQAIAILNRSSDDFSNLLFYNYAGSSVLGGIGNSSGRIRIMTGGVGDTYERLSITSGGNVGIGTSSPNYKLSVAPPATYGNAEDGNISISASASGGTVSAPTTAGGIVFGDQNVTNGYAGRLAVVQDSPSNSSSTHMRFYTNSGGGNTATNERMRITSGGNVLINTQTDSGYRLDVNGTGRFTGQNLRLGSSGAGDSVITINSQNGSYSEIRSNSGAAGSFNGIMIASNYNAANSLPSWSIDLGGCLNSTTNTNSYTVGYKPNGGSWSSLMVIASNGAATFSSTVTASGGFFNSDIRLKDLTDYDYNVSDIKPITYLWKDGRDNKKHVGYSAQEVQKVMPDAVNEDEKGFLSVNYVEVLVAQVNFLTKRIEELEKIVSK